VGGNSEGGEKGKKWLVLIDAPRGGEVGFGE